jgi:NADPH:quinone reductase-like Zn-dependent oxidoreductase
LHLPAALNYLKPNGRYITCGFKNQHESFAEVGDNVSNDRFDSLLLNAMINDISVMGNCIGTHEDLIESVKRFDSNNWLPIDSVLSIRDGAQFLSRTYSDRHRFGKIVLRYL